MRNLIRLFTILIFVSALFSSSTVCQPIQKKLKNANKGEAYYTQFSLFYEYGRHYTTNYRRGKLVPVNTLVTFIKTDGNEIFITLPNDQEISLFNISGYSGENLKGIFKRTLSTSEVDLSKFTEEEQKAIKAGEVRVGMSKAAVLVAIGYPPQHRTPSLESDRWYYWSSRYNTFTVEFESDMVVDIRN